MKVELPRNFNELLTSKAIGKSFAFADALLIRATSKKVLIACVREVKSSIIDSVYKLIVDRIKYYGLNEYKIYEDKIVNTKNKSKFIFKGLLEYNAQNIKSLEGVDICWCEEAQKISKKAWEILDPTIRKEGAEIWLSLNREEEMDPVWKALAIKEDEDVVVKKVNYYDNPYCPNNMKKLALKMKEENYEEYLHIWEGEPRSEAGNHLIGRGEVYKAFDGEVGNVGGFSPLIVGVDVARFGDDKTAVCFRRGRIVEKFLLFEKLDVVQVAHQISGIIAECRPQKVFIDVGGCGAGVFDILVNSGFVSEVEAVNFGERAENSERYVNRRAEMWDRIREWLNCSLKVQLPKIDGIVEDLTAPLKMYDSLGRLQLEPKADIKKRLGKSPDIGDALALTFAVKNVLMFNERKGLRYEYVDDGIYF